MASVNFEKLHDAGSVKAMLRHCDKTERKVRQHANEDIDKSRSDQNVDFIGYREACKRYDERIRELDRTTNQNKRKDRVSCFGLCLTAPARMKLEDTRAFLTDAYEHIRDKYGRENIVGASIHYDEIHKYIADGKEHESLAHLHVYVVPEIDGQLLGKKFSSKAKMIELNRELDQICMQRYHVPFMTHERARKMDQRILKNLSLEEADRVRDQNIALKRNNKRLLEQKTDLEGQKAYLEESKTKLVERNRQLREDRDEIKKYLRMDSKKEQEMFHYMEQCVDAQGRSMAEHYLDYIQKQIEKRIPERHLNIDRDLGDDLER